jgi:PAS domain-containing protein
MIILYQVFENCTTEVSHLLLDEDEDNNNNSSNKNSKYTRHSDEFVAFKNIQTQSKIGVNPPRQIARVLMEPDFRLIEALIHSQQNFVLSDPSLPDNPIVYCSDGFCNLTGYKRASVIGKCVSCCVFVVVFF